MNSRSAHHSGPTAFEAWTPDGTCYARVSIHGPTLGVQLEPDIRQFPGEQVAERLIACNDVAYLKGRVATRKAVQKGSHSRSLEGLETQAELDAATCRLRRYTLINQPAPLIAGAPVIAANVAGLAEIYASLDGRGEVASSELNDFCCGLDELIRNVATIERTATDLDAVVAVTLGCDGRLIRLRMDNCAPYRLTHLTLEAKLNDTLRDALDQIQAAWKEIGSQHRVVIR